MDSTEISCSKDSLGLSKRGRAVLRVDKASFMRSSCAWTSLSVSLKWFATMSKWYTLRPACIFIVYGILSVYVMKVRDKNSDRQEGRQAGSRTTL